MQRPFDLKDFYNLTQGASRIALVDMGFLGDTLHLIPALWEVRRHYPEASIHLLTSPVGKAVLDLVPGLVDEVEVVRWPSSLPVRFAEKCRAALRLAHKRFDVAINFSGADRSILFTCLTRARWRMASSGGRSHFWNRWCIPFWAAPPDPAIPVYEQKRQVLAACGMQLDPVRWDLSMNPESRRRAESLVPAGAVHFSINASDALKEWPLEHWIALACRCLSADPQLQIVATGSDSPREQERLRCLKEKVGNPRLILLPPGMPIADLAAALQHCKLHVGSDSGVLHLAVAVGIPTISFFRENAGAKGWVPVGPRHHVWQLPCRCVNQTPVCAEKEGGKCLAGLSVDTVEREIAMHMTKIQTL